MHLLPPPLDYWFTSFFFLAGPGPLHEIVVSAFSRSRLGRANTFQFLFLLLTPRKSLKCFSSFILFFSASLSLNSILYFTSVLYPANFSMDSISSWFPPISFHTFSTTLSHPIPARPSVTFSHTARPPMAGSLFSGMFLTLYRHFSVRGAIFGIFQGLSWAVCLGRAGPGRDFSKCDGPGRTGPRLLKN